MEIRVQLLGVNFTFLIQEQFNFGFKRWFHIWKFFLTCQMVDTIIETPVEYYLDGFDILSVVVFEVVVHVVHVVICGDLTSLIKTWTPVKEVKTEVKEVETFIHPSYLYS